jgi:hypothetical protein
MWKKGGDFLKMAGLLVGGSTTLCAEEFAAPAEWPVPFRSDQVPLEVTTMLDFSERLTRLVDSQESESASGRRRVAQLLALALALDPANVTASQLLVEFTAGRSRPAADLEEIEKFRTSLQPYLTWLETPAAGGSGQALAACLRDVMTPLDSKDAPAEQGAWRDWIPPLAAYETKPVEPEKITPAEPTAAIPLLAKATVSSIFPKLEKVMGEQQWILTHAPLLMTAAGTETEERAPFSLTIGSTDYSEAFENLSTQLVKLLEKQPTKLPEGISVTLSGNALDDSASSRKRQNISAAAAVLASAAVTGQRPGNVTILGVIDEYGAFKLSPGFWDQLKALKPGTGERLVLPTAAAEYLPAMLVLNQPEFFMKYEVLLASNFTELLDLTAETPNETLVKVSTHFRECCQKSMKQQLLSYLADPVVNRRLTEITRLAPYHYSAKILGCQVVTNRPQFFCRPVLAAELRNATALVGRLLTKLDEDSESSLVEKLTSKAYDLGRDQVNTLSRIAERHDQDLIAGVQNTLTAVRNLERASKSHDYDDEIISNMNKARETLERSYSALLAKLTRAASDQPDPLPRKTE